MTVSEADFKTALGRFPTGVTVVTTRDGERPDGVTVNAFASISLTPPLVMVSIDKRSHMHDLIARTRFFAANILCEDQSDLSRRFAGQTADRTDRFAGVAWRESTTSAPILNDVIAFVDCRVTAIYPAGDHSIFLGEVESVGVTPGAPLLYYRGRYGRLEEPADAPVRTGQA